MQRWMSIVAALAISLASSCLDVVRFDKQEAQLVYDEKSDTAEMLLIYEGVTHGSDDALYRAADRVEAMLAKKRYFIVGDWPFEIALDDVDDKLHNALDELAQHDPGAQSPQALAAECLRGVEVADVGAFSNADDSFSIYQRLRLPKFSRLVAAINAWVDQSVLESQTQSAELDAQTWSQWVDKAKRKDPWVVLGARSIECRLPMSPKDTAQLLREVASFGEDDAMPRGLVRSISEVEWKDGELRLRIAADARGRFRFDFGTPHGASRDAKSSELYKLLEARSHARGREWKTNTALAAVRDLLLH